MIFFHEYSGSDRYYLRNKLDFILISTMCNRTHNITLFTIKFHSWLLVGRRSKTFILQNHLHEYQESYNHYLRGVFDFVHDLITSYVTQFVHENHEYNEFNEHQEYNNKSSMKPLLIFSFHECPFPW